MAKSTLGNYKFELLLLIGFFLVCCSSLLLLYFYMPANWSFDYLISRINFNGIIRVLLIILCTFILEIYLLGWRHSSLFKLLFRFDLSAKNDLFISLFYYLNLGAVLAGLFSFGTSKIIPDLLNEWIGSEVLLGIPNYLVQFLIFLVVADFAAYWHHRIMHELQFLWELHKFHHSATDFLVITGGREHPLEHAYQRIFQAIPLAFLGAYVHDFIAVILVFNIQSVLNHSMIDWRFGWIGRWMIYSPVDHRIHHSKEYEHWDKNYGAFFVIWDRIFGTYYTGKLINKEVGLSVNEFNKRSVVYDLFQPIRMSLRSLVKSIQTGRWAAEHKLKENAGKYQPARTY